MGLTSRERLEDSARSLVARARAGRRWRRPIAYAAASSAILLWAVVSMPVPLWLRAVVGGSIAALAVVSDVLYRRLRPVLGRATSFAAVCLAWAAVWSGLALADPSCLGPAGSGRCTPSAVGSFALLGLMFPLVVPAFTLVPWAAFRAGRVIWRRFGR